MHPDLHLSYPVITRRPNDKPVSTDFIADFREFYKLFPYGNVFDWLQFIKAENKQGNITAEECNDIIRKLSLHAFQSRYKVLVLWMPEYLGKEGNKLLKLIEEPPADTLFILAAENEEAILPTIISRCQVLRVPPLEDADVEGALVHRCRLGPEQARQIAVVVDGNYHEALLLHQHNDQDWNTLLKSFLNASLGRGADEPKRFANTVKVVGELAELGREKQKQLLQYFLQLIEISIRMKIIGPQKLNLPTAEAEFAARLLKVAGLSQMKAVAAEIENAVYYIERNANAKILFHALAIKVRGILNEKTVLLTS
jgi:DNA polymerase-3 subunit delta'